MISLLFAALEYHCQECYAGPGSACAGKHPHGVRLSKASVDPDIIRATAESMMYSGETFRWVEKKD